MNWAYWNPVRIRFGSGLLDEVAGLIGNRRWALVTYDQPIFRELSARLTAVAGAPVVSITNIETNPDCADLALSCSQFGAAEPAEVIVALGGGSMIDAAKVLAASSGDFETVRRHLVEKKPLDERTIIPIIAVPTTAGTGSEAQSYALISDADSRDKLACGDPKAAFRVAVLDPELTLSLPRGVTATAGYDALSHAVEAYVTTRRNLMSALLAREAFRLLEGSFERVLDAPADVEARGAMLLGAHLAGLAIEASMLGATHACANPLSARYGTTHGVAIALLLPHVVRWNAAAAAPLYAELLRAAGRESVADPAAALADRLEELAVRGDLPRRLRAAGVNEGDLAALAGHAAEQWTGRFNPRPFDAGGALELYRAAY